MSDEFASSNLRQLPKWLQAKIRELNVRNPDEWVRQAIPALANRSVVELATSDEGERVLRDYFAKVIGR